MMFVVGTDEAGYGPNLGPLVISATLWQVAPERPIESLSTHLSAIRIPADPAAAPIIGDSKRLYTPGAGLAALECGVLATLALAEGPAPPARTWRELLARLDPGRVADLAATPWDANFDCGLPLDAAPALIAAAQAQCAAGLSAAGLRLMDLRSRVVFPAEFNERIVACGSKGTALSHWTLELVRDLMEPLGEASILVQCDKHGGRNHYGALLQHVFAATWLDVQEESRQQSVYRWETAAQRGEARFVAKGEQFLPAALASMVSKYVRELAMKGFNDFWVARVPGLHRTAGYPTDARRFHAEIQAAQHELAVADARLWRMR